MQRIDLDRVTGDLLGLDDQLRANLVLVDNFNPSLIKVERLEPQIISQSDQMALLIEQLHLDLVKVLLNQDVRVL